MTHDIAAQYQQELLHLLEVPRADLQVFGQTETFISCVCTPVGPTLGTLMLLARENVSSSGLLPLSMLGEDLRMLCRTAREERHVIGPCCCDPDQS
ncbi:hypothetical protein [Deinococcus pimensis]|uniref:hypothetical protein n=1 Tax=Deinococcus pimensis TaxID=309888 RepID=UPI0004834C21|nr:hypothetical protein [Deinococcus pimensis]